MTFSRQCGFTLLAAEQEGLSSDLLATAEAPQAEGHLLCCELPAWTPGKLSSIEI